MWPRVSRNLSRETNHILFEGITFITGLKDARIQNSIELELTIEKWITVHLRKQGIMRENRPKQPTAGVG